MIRRTVAAIQGPAVIGYRRQPGIAKANVVSAWVRAQNRIPLGIGIAVQRLWSSAISLPRIFLKETALSRVIVPRSKVQKSCCVRILIGRGRVCRMYSSDKPYPLGDPRGHAHEAKTIVCPHSGWRWVGRSQPNPTARAPRQVLAEAKAAHLGGHFRCSSAVDCRATEARNLVSVMPMTLCDVPSAGRPYIPDC